MIPRSLALPTSLSASTMGSQKLSLFGLHIRMRRSSMKIPSNSSLTLGKLMKEVISPRILPINFTAGKDVPSYEFYNPSVVARQLGFGQVPPSPFFVGKVQFRGALNVALSYSRLKDMEPSADMALLADWQITPFVTTPFIQWWSECQEHRFCRVASLYC